MALYTKNGIPLQVSGTTVYSRSGKVVGRIRGDKVFGTDGRYVGSIVGDRLVYRTTHSSAVGSSFASASRAGTAKAQRAGSAISGEEPTIPT
ncbi:4-fold beta flower protein [Pseudomonas sp. efr-133-TYG-103a]|uniref:4-fold beta flower protein n=1 Tax=Pseudomonas sp. efr-133-TYG-103a TaxID=3040308 RepID=UPI00359C9B47